MALISLQLRKTNLRKTNLIFRHLQSINNILLVRRARLNWIIGVCTSKPGACPGFWWGGSTFWSEATDGVVFSASEAARSAAERATAGVRGHSPRWGFGGEAPNGGSRGAKPPGFFLQFYCYFTYLRAGEAGHSTFYSVISHVTTVFLQGMQCVRRGISYSDDHPEAARPEGQSSPAEIFCELITLTQRNLSGLLFNDKVFD